jgi:T5SS/PEP-CTERM-associated repeat protein
MKRSLPLAAVLCAALLLSVARGRAQNLYVGSNAANETTNFTSGTNAFASIYVGYTNNWAFSATNNLLTVSGAGTVLTNSSYFYVGFNGSDNRLIISDGGQVISGTGSLGSSSTSTNNSVLVTGTNSRWTLQKFTTGTQSHANSLVISNGGQVKVTGMLTEVLSSSNRILVTGVGSRLDVSSLYFGYQNKSGNSLVISNGATVAASFTFIGTASSSNSVLVTGTGSLFTNDDLTIGLGISSSGNRMVVSNGGKVISGFLTIGAGSSRYASSPPPGSVDPTSVLVTGTNSLLIATNSLTVGVDSDNNRLTVADGGSVSVGQDLIINQFYPNTNGFDQAGSLVLVQSGRLSVTNGTISFGAGLGTLQVDGGTVEVGKDLVVRDCGRRESIKGCTRDPRGSAVAQAVGR